MRHISFLISLFLICPMLIASPQSKAKRFQKQTQPSEVDSKNKLEETLLKVIREDDEADDRGDFTTTYKRNAAHAVVIGETKNQSIEEYVLEQKKNAEQMKLIETQNEFAPPIYKDVKTSVFGDTAIQSHVLVNKRKVKKTGQEITNQYLRTINSVDKK